MEYRIVRPNQTRIDEIVDLCAAHAEFEKSDYSKRGKADQLIASLWSNEPSLNCLVAESDDRYVGYITWMIQYSTWDADEYIYMDCLFIEKEYRGYGIGEELVNYMKEFGRVREIQLIQWQTPDFNKRAMKFYTRIGAISKSKERYFLKI